MPIIRITLFEGAPKELKAQLVKNLTDTVAATLGKPLEAVSVYIEEFKKENVSKKGVLASEADEPNR